ncbi:O-antigen ligase family protein [Jeongeupia naejangsanensis]|uniref:O-antigen ligase family protein n=1 Tax=Jeongeupia naejangsanensis TaxID=613195 RepID=A0ABS2BLQ3_9NEIS|nr:O-antigen ligase family protein [Jeongeupia naejangsanensis]MBM3116538.1 O-antigen ligase family protein [Jeongeupia naejangsanensis]
MRNLLGSLTLTALIQGLLFIYLPLAANTALPGLRNTSLGLLLLLSLYVLIRQRPKVDKCLAISGMGYLLLVTASFLTLTNIGASSSEFVRSMLAPTVLAMALLAVTKDFDVKAQLKLTVLASVLTTLLYAWSIHQLWGALQANLFNRDYGFRFLVFLPFLLLALISKLGRIWTGLAALLLVLQVIAIGLMGFRGAWLGLVTVVLLFVWRHLTTKGLLVLAAVVIAVGVASASLTKQFAPQTYQYVETKLRQTDSSGRVDFLWKPTITMIRDTPLLGHGYGNANFSKIFAAEAPKHDDWLWKDATHPHNIWLEVAFATGLVGAALLLTIMLRSGWLLWQRSREGNPLAEAALLGLIGFYGVLGMTEPLAWAPLGLFAGIALAQSARFGDRT